MEQLIGRKRECRELEWAMESGRSEFILLYGRRRVGKTFLIRSFFNDSYTFHFVGAHKKGLAHQLKNFKEALCKFNPGTTIPEITDWHTAFGLLERYLESCTDRRKVLFFDELPWADTHGSTLMDELEYFWANWVQNRDDIVLIACGSATSWMKEKIEDNQGGLHNRVTHRIYLRPFFLNECREYLHGHGFDWDDYTIIQCYMIFGGIPYYLSLLRPYLSLNENVDNLLFQKSGDLSSEFDELYYALFHNADRYLRIVELLARKREGFTRQEIEKETGLSGGGLSKMIDNLEMCDFISTYRQFGNKTKLSLIKLCDPFTLFYFKFMKHNSSRDEAYWQHHFQDRSTMSWMGFSFEELCLRHLQHIKHGLGISGIATESSAWRFIPQKGDDRKGTQVDLVIKRVDRITHLCEMKFSESRFVIDKNYEQLLKERRECFRDVTGAKGGVVITMICPAGLKQGSHNSLIHSEITARELFAELE